MNRLPLTPKGHAALVDELRNRVQIERPRLIERIQDSIADDTNLVENSEYQATITERELNEARIAELEDKIARAEIIDVTRLSGNVVKFGATVTLIDEDTGEKKTWQIVGESEADARNRKISVAAPLARALIGRAKSAVVEVNTPGGARAYKIDRIDWGDPLNR